MQGILLIVRNDGLPTKTALAHVLGIDGGAAAINQIVNSPMQHDGRPRHGVVDDIVDGEVQIRQNPLERRVVDGAQDVRIHAVALLSIESQKVCHRK
jgi:hypothetical protein